LNPNTRFLIICILIGVICASTVTASYYFASGPRTTTITFIQTLKAQNSTSSITLPSTTTSYQVITVTGASFTSTETETTPGPGLFSVSTSSSSQTSASLVIIGSTSSSSSTSSPSVAIPAICNFNNATNSVEAPQEFQIPECLTGNASEAVPFRSYNQGEIYLSGSISSQQPIKAVIASYGSTVLDQSGTAITFLKLAISPGSIYQIYLSNEQGENNSVLIDLDFFA
jgi:hypothetical protein